ncbi:MAG: hypothetical protein AAGF87_07995 [Bacteroidota bacterium]
MNKAGPPSKFSNPSRDLPIILDDPLNPSEEPDRLPFGRSVRL